jgi:hypothetical protein
LRWHLSLKKGSGPVGRSDDSGGRHVCRHLHLHLHEEKANSRSTRRLSVFGAINRAPATSMLCKGGKKEKTVTFLCREDQTVLRGKRLAFRTRLQAPSSLFCTMCELPSLLPTRTQRRKFTDSGTKSRRMASLET